MNIKDFIKFLEHFPENTEIKVPQALYFYAEADVAWIDFSESTHAFINSDIPQLLLGDI